MFFQRPQIGFSISNGSVCRVKLYRKKWGGTLSSLQSELFGPGVIQSTPSAQNVLDPAAYRQACLKLLSNCKKGTQYYLSLPETSVRVKCLTFQSLPKNTKERDQLIKWQMSKTFLSAQKPTQLVYQDMGLHQGKNRLLAMTIEKEILEAYEAPFREKNMEAACIGIFPFHLYNLYHAQVFKASLPKQNFILIIVHNCTYSVLICRKGILDFVRIKQLPKTRDSTPSPVLDPIVRETLTSLTAYQEVTVDFEPSHLFLIGDTALSQLDMSFKEILGLTPMHLSLDKSEFLHLKAPLKDVPYDALGAAIAVLAGDG